MALSFKIEHFAICVSDLERSIAWYKTCFGFEEVRRFEKTEFEIKAAVLKLDTFLLEIIQPALPEKPLPEKRALNFHFRKTGVNHFSFTVTNVRSAFDSFKNSNPEFITELMDGRYFFCTDPDGSLIEIKQGK
jgi:catechol 2,3-dioxygenase-like lactoylglutathione lyase family enzyme